MWEGGRSWCCYYWVLNMLQSGIFLRLELFEELENQLCALFEVLPLQWGRNPNWLSLLMYEPESFSLGLHPKIWMQWHNGDAALVFLFLFSFCSPSSLRSSKTVHAWSHLWVPAAVGLAQKWGGLALGVGGDLILPVLSLKQVNCVEPYIVTWRRQDKIKRKGNKTQGPLPCPS